MSKLRDKMKMDMELKGYSPGTIKGYIAQVNNFARFHNKSPELLREKKYVNILDTFNNYEQRTYGYVDLEKKLLGK